MQCCGTPVPQLTRSKQFHQWNDLRTVTPILLLISNHVSLHFRRHFVWFLLLQNISIRYSFSHFKTPDVLCRYLSIVTWLPCCIYFFFNHNITIHTKTLFHFCPNTHTHIYIWVDICVLFDIFVYIYIIWQSLAFAKLKHMLRHHYFHISWFMRRTLLFLI